MSPPRIGVPKTGQTVWIVKRAPDGTSRGFAATIGKIGRQWAELDGVTGLRLQISSGMVGANAEALVGEAWNTEEEWQAKVDRDRTWTAFQRAVRGTLQPPAGAQFIREAAEVLGLKLVDGES